MDEKRDHDLWLLLPRPVRRFRADLAAVIALVAVTIVAVLAPVVRETPLRIVVGLPFVLFLPGYTFIAALFPEANEGPAIDDDVRHGSGDAEADDEADDGDLPPWRRAGKPPERRTTVDSSDASGDSSAATRVLARGSPAADLPALSWGPAGRPRRRQRLPGTAPLGQRLGGRPANSGPGLTGSDVSGTADFQVTDCGPTSRYTWVRR